MLSGTLASVLIDFGCFRPNGAALVQGETETGRVHYSAEELVFDVLV